MIAVGKQERPDVEHWVLQCRAAHVYLDAMQGLASAERRQQNRAEAEAVLRELERYLDADCDPLARSRVEALTDGLRTRLARSSA